MSEYVVVKKNLFLKNSNLKNEVRSCNSKLVVHKPINNGRKGNGPSKFRCWTCGLSKGDAELCKRCLQSYS
jgi:hypothetical protein